MRVVTWMMTSFNENPNLSHAKLKYWHTRIYTTDPWVTLCCV